MKIIPTIIFLLISGSHSFAQEDVFKRDDSSDTARLTNLLNDPVAKKIIADAPIKSIIRDEQFQDRYKITYVGLIDDYNIGDCSVVFSTDYVCAPCLPNSPYCACAFSAEFEKDSNTCGIPDLLE